MRKRKLIKSLSLILVLLLTVSTNLSAASITLTFDDLDFGINDDCQLVGGYMVCNDQGRQDINLRLLERVEYREELEAQVDSKPSLRLFWFGLGFLVGGGTIAALTN